MMNAHFVLLSPKKFQQCVYDFDHSLEAVLTFYDLNVVVPEPFFSLVFQPQSKTPHTLQSVLYL